MEARVFDDAEDWLFGLALIWSYLFVPHIWALPPAVETKTLLSGGAKRRCGPAMPRGTAYARVATRRPGDMPRAARRLAVALGLSLYRATLS